jgi:hypothetical protein
MDEPVINPYQSPTSDQTGHGTLDEINRTARPAYSLYSVRSVTLGAALGSLLAGGIVMAINYKRLGQGAAAIHAILWSAVATAAIIAVGIMAPDEAHIPNAAFLVPQIIGMYYVAKSLQGPTVEAHRREGGSLASSWGAAGIGILTLFVLLGALIGILIET